MSACTEECQPRKGGRRCLVLQRANLTNTTLRERSKKDYVVWNEHNRTLKRHERRSAGSGLETGLSSAEQLSPLQRAVLSSQHPHAPLSHPQLQVQGLHCPLATTEGPRHLCAQIHTHKTLVHIQINKPKKFCKTKTEVRQGCQVGWRGGRRAGASCGPQRSWATEC